MLVSNLLFVVFKVMNDQNYLPFCVYVYHFQAIRSVLDLRNRGDVIRLEWLGNNEREEMGRDEKKVNKREKKEERTRRWRGWQVSTRQAFVHRIFESTKTL